MQIPIPDTADLKSALELHDNPTFVATGGFKAVFRSENLDGTVEAVKAVYIPSASTDEESLQRKQLIARAKREIEALNKIQHPGIVKLGQIPAEMQKLGQHEYLVYSEEFLGGADLSSWIKANSQAEYSDLSELMLSLVDLIEATSSDGFLHRDIKPENIIETDDSDRRFVVLDMGIAYKMDGTEITLQGGAPGTIRYMAPEMLKVDYKETMDFRCDLYSAALTVYVLASKQHPFAPRPENQYATVYRIMNTSPVPLGDLRSDLPPRFSKIIDRCIRKRAALRYSKLDTLREELLSI